MDWNSIFSLFGPNGAQAATNPFNFADTGGFMNSGAGANFPPAANLPDMTQGGAAVTMPSSLGIPQIMAQVFQNHGLTPGQVAANPQAAAETVRQAGPSTPSLGASLGGGGNAPGTISPSAAMPPGWTAGGAPWNPQAPTQGSDIGQRLQQALKGVTAPPAPQGQTLHPAVPPTGRGTVQPSRLIALLQAMGVNRPQVPSLSQAIGGR